MAISRHEAFWSLRKFQRELALKIGQDLNFTCLSQNELKMYFVIFDEEILAMSERLERLVLLYGENDAYVKFSANQMGYKMRDLTRIWENFSLVGKP